MKTCFKCGASKSLKEFYAHPRMADGYLGKCKECTKRDARDRYLAKPDVILAYELSRAQLPKRQEAKRLYSQRYRAVHKAKRAETLLKYKTQHPERYAARVLVGNYVRDGKLRKLPCEMCGNAKSEAHHEDYSKPLQVRWLCRKHHAELHRKHKY